MQKNTQEEIKKSKTRKKKEISDNSTENKKNKKTVKPKETVKETKSRKKRIKTEEIIEKTSIEDTSIIEPVKQNNRIEINDAVPKAKFNKPAYLLFGLVGLIIILLIISLINNSGSRNTYKLLTLCEQCFTEDAKIVLPKEYKLTKDGMLLVEDDNYFETVGGIYPASITEEDYYSQIEELKEYYELEDLSKEDYTCYKLSETYGDNEISYYFVYKKDVMFQITFINEEDNIIDTILKNLYY